MNKPLPQISSKKYSDNYDDIFKRKPQPKTFEDGVPRTCKEISGLGILIFLSNHQSVFSTHGDGSYAGGSIPSVEEAMPKGTPERLQIAKMKTLVRKGLVDGCGCGCRGDWQITRKGIDHVARCNR